jgi:hypothetical protein
MKLFKICSQDPILDFIRENYQANPLKVPDKRVRPLYIIGNDDSNYKFFGHLNNLLSKAIPDIEVKESELIDLSMVKSSQIKTVAATSFLEGILSKISDTNFLPSLKSNFNTNNIKSINFFFPGPKREFVDLFDFGKKINNSSIDKNPTSSLFVRSKNPFQIFLIDSVISSQEIGISFESSKEAKIEFDSKVYEELIKADLKLQKDSSNNLIIKSMERLTFAFSCVRLVLSNELKIIEIEPEFKVNYTGAFESSSLNLPKYHLIGEPSDLIEFE